MCRFLKRHKITLKKKTYRGERVKSDEVQQQRCEFWQKLKDVKAENIISIDETGIWQGMERSVARSEEGRHLAIGVVTKVKNTQSLGLCL